MSLHSTPVCASKDGTPIPISCAERFDALDIHRRRVVDEFRTREAVSVIEAEPAHANGGSSVAPRRASSAARALAWIALVAWGASVVGGSLALWRYKTKPGLAASAPSEWPRASHLSLASGRSTLVLFAHPYCPCTRASVDELARVMARVSGSVDATVVFARVDDEEPSAAPLWARATAIPGVHALADDGAEATRFGVKTSGQVMLFAPSGRLLFSGGITSARGHAGDNAGASRIVELATGSAASGSNAPVFGCAYDDLGAQDEEGRSR
jgi:hypothetical protein